MIINPYRYASGPTILLRDTFTGAAGELSSHSPEIGGAWVEYNGDTELDGSGEAVLVVGAVQTVAYQDVGVADVTANLTLGATLPGSYGIGVAVNVDAAGNYWAAVAESLGTKLNLLEVATNSSFTSRATVALGSAPPTGQIINCVTAGDTITASIDGGSEISYTGSPRAHKDHTGVGIKGFFLNEKVTLIEVTG